MLNEKGKLNLLKVIYVHYIILKILETILALYAVIGYKKKNGNKINLYKKKLYFLFHINLNMLKYYTFLFILKYIKGL